MLQGYVRDHTCLFCGAVLLNNRNLWTANLQRPVNLRKWPEGAPSYLAKVTFRHRQGPAIFQNDLTIMSRARLPVVRCSSLTCPLFD
jgi:hypothetical protein